MALPRVQTESWPLVYVGLAPDTGAEEYADHYRRIRAMLEHNDGEFVVLMDARKLRAHSFGSERRRAAAAGLAEIQPFFNRMHAQAFVVGDRMTRGLVSSYLWITPRPYPTRVVIDLVEAVDWLQSFVPLPQPVKQSIARMAELR